MTKNQTHLLGSTPNYHNQARSDASNRHLILCLVLQSLTGSSRSMHEACTMEHASDSRHQQLRGQEECTDFTLSNRLVMKAAPLQANVSAVEIFLVVSLRAMRGRPDAVITPWQGSETMIHSIGMEN